ncbi:MAG: hypothetical protein HN936_01230 [Bacteroidetes bacterium]|nr:hypothetical protein [Candidatus Neomarinimicrobiota bacterium]MBT6013164.1 hypothetical protein [Candidatus Neomarinimicrobiota bacterium]MBT7091837.1 hypothetical protein [Bacteroidota bacterium]
MANKNIEVIISDQSPSNLVGQEYITRTKRKQFDRDIQKLVEGESADFLGRAWSEKNGAVYQIFTVGDKRVLVEDPDATEVMKSMFDEGGQLRSVDLK